MKLTCGRYKLKEPEKSDDKNKVISKTNLKNEECQLFKVMLLEKENYPFINFNYDKLSCSLSIPDKFRNIPPEGFSNSANLDLLKNLGVIFESLAKDDNIPIAILRPSEAYKLIHWLNSMSYYLRCMRDRQRQEGKNDMLEELGVLERSIWIRKNRLIKPERELG